MSLPPSRFRFGPFVVERPAYRVLRNGQALTLSPKLVDLLLYFVSRPSVLVTKDELFAAIWPDVTVTENALTQAISDLRQALGDEPASPTYIQTVARRGYRFIAPVEALPAIESDAPAHAEPAPAGDLGMVRSVAVLDFTNVSADPELAWLATGSWHPGPEAAAPVTDRNPRRKAAAAATRRTRSVRSERACRRDHPRRNGSDAGRASKSEPAFARSATISGVIR